MTTYANNKSMSNWILFLPIFLIYLVINKVNCEDDGAGIINSKEQTSLERRYSKYVQTGGRRRCILLDECIDHLEDSADVITVLSEERTVLMDMSKELLAKVMELQNKNKILNKTQATMKEMEDKIRELEYYNNIHMNQIMNSANVYYDKPYNGKQKSGADDKIEKLTAICQDLVKETELDVASTGTYYFYNDIENHKTWYEAQQFCRLHGMDLLSLDSTEENDYISDKLLGSPIFTSNEIYELEASRVLNYNKFNLKPARQIKNKKNGQTEDLFYWYGLQNMNDKATWVWVGTGLNATFFNWRVGQPFSPTLQRCAGSTQAGGQISWIANFCNKKGLFVCELLEPCLSILK